MNYDSKNIKEFIESAKGTHYGYEGLTDTNIMYRPDETCWLYLLNEDDIAYDETKNFVYLNIGRYSKMKLSFLLYELFNQFEDKFCLTKEMQKQNVKLVLNNDVTNQDKTFFETIDEFFAYKQIKIEKQGCWK